LRRNQYKEMIALPRIRTYNINQQLALGFEAPFPQTFLLQPIDESLEESSAVELVESVLEPPMLSRGCTDVTVCTEIVHDIIDSLTASQLETALLTAENLSNILPPELLRRNTSDSSWDLVSPIG